MNPGNLESISLATQILCCAITTPLVGLRLYARLKLHHPFGIEDVSCYLAWILFIGHCICTLCYTFCGGHISSDPSNTPGHRLKLKIFYIATMIYVPMILCVKTSLIYTLIRLWNPYRAKVISLYTFLTMIISYYTVILFVKVFACNPIHLFWEYNYSGGSCLNRQAIFVADSTISVLTDLAILLFPIVLTWGLQMPVAKKIHVVVILGAGGTAIAFSIYRLVLVVVGNHRFIDQEVLYLKLLLSDNAEGGLGIVCTCIPAINKMLHYWKQEYKKRKEWPLAEFQSLGVTS